MWDSAYAIIMVMHIAIMAKYVDTKIAIIIFRYLVPSIVIIMFTCVGPYIAMKMISYIGLKNPL
jgi:hypothetical protein